MFAVAAVLATGRIQPRMGAQVSPPRLIHLTSLDQLRDVAPAWDDLWRRSRQTLPTVRAELVAQWIERFAPGAESRALAVEDGGRWVAALPLVGRKVARVLDAGTLPVNEWSTNGDLLLDPAAGTEGPLDVLVEGIAGLPWPLLWLEEVAFDRPCWQAFTAAAARAGMAAHFREHLQLGRIEIDHDWEAYKRGWSRKHRQQMARHARRLAERGDVRLRVLSNLSSEEAAGWVRRGLEVEDRSWKGTTGTSVLRTPEMAVFYARQAEQLARWGQLELVFLECAGEPVAFSYGLSAKGVYHSLKVGYDPAYASYSPGQLLRYHWFRQMHNDPCRRAIDSMPPSDAHRKWRPTTYAVGRLVIAARRVPARLVLEAYKRCWPLVRRLGSTAGQLQ